MTPEEVGRRVCSGMFLIVGELRGCDIQEAGFVDNTTGIAEKTLLLTYYIECPKRVLFDVVKVTFRMPLGDERAETLKKAVQKGRLYAFEIAAIEKKPGFVLARMAGTVPELVEQGTQPGCSAGGAAPGARP